MDKEKLIDSMLELIQEVLEDEGTEDTITATRSSPLLGADAIAGSLRLVSFIADFEMLLEDDYGLELSLVSEEALSRSKSPFRTIETLADYTLELAVSEEVLVTAQIA